MRNPEAITLGEIAQLTGGRIEGDPSVGITGVAPLTDAGPGDITFIADAKHLKLLAATRATAVIVREGSYEAAGKNLLLVKNPQVAFAAALGRLRPAVRPTPGIHERAEVHPGAEVSEGVSIGPFAVVEDGARIGERAVIYPGVYIGSGASVGADTVLYPGVAVREGCHVGARVIIHCNSVVGSDGFGYARDGARYVKIPQAGTVRIEDDVEVGACVTIDRATLGETVIGRGTKIDNLVQVAHNVTIGEDTVLVAQVGIAGSASIGSRVQLGGQAGVAGHIKVGDDVMAGAKTGIHSSIEPSRVVSGFPAINHGDWLRAGALFAKLPEMKKKITELEKRIRVLEGSVDEDDNSG